MSVISAPLLLVDGSLRGPGAVVVADGRIVDVLGHRPPPGEDHTELPDGLLTAGLVDLQVNGFAGHDLIAADEAGWQAVFTALPATGVTSFLGTFITAPLPVLQGGLERASAMLDRADGARLVGVHIEGPFLSPARQGAHDAALMISPDPGAVTSLLAHRSLVAVTLAPERDRALAATARFAEAGVVVSLGHSDATATQARAGVDAGARAVTHLFNAMRPMHHREPGLAGVALTDDRLAVGLICDLHHVSPEMCALAFRAAPGRIVLVTDAIASAGAPPGRYELGGEVVIAGEAGAPPRRTDGTIAGSSLTLDHAVRNTVSCGVEPAVALAAATAAPARALSRSDIGVLAPGAYADLVWWTSDLHVRRTWIAGRVV